MLNRVAFCCRIEYSLLMNKKIWNYIETHHMFEKGDRVIAGISGGADSVCLLFVLLELRERLGIEIIAVHVNHGLRGETAKRDEAFTRRLCEEHQISCIICRENVELIAGKRKQSIEEAGRMVRRECFYRVMKESRGTKIALAHHQNDNAETLLMNLARGTGLRGLGGIRPVNGRIVRPLLCMNRREIEEYLQTREMNFCEDETNADDTYTRNRIRHRIVPVLEQEVNRQAVRHMNETMEQLQEVWEYMRQQTDAAYKQSVEFRENSTGAQSRDRISILIREKEFTQFPKILQKMVIQRCLEEAASGAKDLTSAHIEAVLELLKKQTGRSRNLPGKIQAERVYEGILIEKEAKKKESDEFLEQMLKIPGTTRLGSRNMSICCTILEKDDDFSAEQIPQKPYTKWFDYDIITRSLTVRGRQAEDVIGIDREGRTQKLKSYFINEKIPAKLRGEIPLIAEGSQIIWVVGYRMNSRYQVSDKTKRILEIKITEDKKDGRDN